MFSLLIVDDEEVICKTLEMMVHRIKSLGEIKTFLASDAYTALQILGEEKIDVILTDLCMDEMDGLTFIQSVMAERSPPDIIAVSAYGNFEYVRNAFKLGVFDYIMKPVEFSTLEAVLLKCRNQPGRNQDEQHDVIAEVKRFVGENIDQNITLVEVSNHVSMDYSYFSKYFKRMTGETFSHYLTAEKMKYCEELLQQQDIKVSELALKMGYNNAGNFSRAFRNYTGKWPSEYKERKRR